MAEPFARRLIGAFLGPLLWQGRRGLVPWHGLAYLVFATVMAAQLAPWDVATSLLSERSGRALQSLCLGGVNLLFATWCAAWFWMYFADDLEMTVRVRPWPMRSLQTVRIGSAIGHSSQLILVTVPMMLASLAVFVMLSMAQLGHGLHLLGYPAFHTAVGLEADKLQACRAAFGNDSHRVLLGLMASFVGTDSDCLKLSPVTHTGGYFLILITVIKALFAAILFSVFTQFGTLVVRRK